MSLQWVLRTSDGEYSALNGTSIPTPSADQGSENIPEEGRKDCESGRMRESMEKCCLLDMPCHCTQELTSAVINCSKPEQDRTSQDSSMDWGVVHETSLTLSRRTDGCWRGEGRFSLGLWSLVGCPCSQWMVPHQCTCRALLSGLGGRRKGRREEGGGKETWS